MIVAMAVPRSCVAAAAWLLAATAAGHDGVTPVVITVDASRTLHETSPEYVSFNFDWHLASDARRRRECARRVATNRELCSTPWQGIARAKKSV